MRAPAAILLVVGLALGGTAIWSHPSDADAPPAAAAAPSLPTAPLRRDPVVKASGVIKPRVGAEVRVGSRLSGVVKRLYVKVGDTVRTGQRLAELDDRDLLANRAEATAKRQLALAELRYAQAKRERQQTMLAAHVISSDDLDQAELAFAVAEQNLAAAEAALRYAEIQLEYAVITAPIAGVVASVATQEGETVSASFAAPTFVTLIDLARLEVWAYVDETDIGRIEAGQPATFTVDTYGDESFPGLVTAIYPKAEIRDNVVNYITVVRFEPRPGRVLRPEMTAIVSLRTPNEAEAAAPAVAPTAPTPLSP